MPKVCSDCSARIEFEKWFFYAEILKFLGPLSMYRRVSKAFIPLEYLTKMCFHFNGHFQNVKYMLDRRPMVSELIFNDCHYKDHDFEDIVNSYKKITDITVTRDTYLTDLPDFPDAPVTSHIDNKFFVLFPPRIVTFTFNGCWKLFSKPSSILSHVVVVDIFLNAVTTCSIASLIVAERFIDMSLGFFYRAMPRYLSTWYWGFVFDEVHEDVASVLIYLKEEFLVMIYLQKKLTPFDSTECWKITSVKIIN